MTHPRRTRISIKRVFIATALVVGAVVVASAHQAEARNNNGGGPRAMMGSVKSNGATMGSTRSNNAIDAKSVGKLRCEGPGCPQLGGRPQTTGTNKADPNPISRDQRQPNGGAGGGVTVTTNGPPRPKKPNSICAGWGCPKPRQPNKETVVNDHRN